MANEGKVYFSPSRHRVYIDKVDEKEEVTDLTTTIPSEENEIRAYSKVAHNRDILAYDKSQNALFFVVIGGIVLIIGILFIFLSLQKRRNKIVGINVASLQFFICVTCLAIGIATLTTGIILLIKALKLKKKANNEIAYISTLKRDI